MRLGPSMAAYSPGNLWPADPRERSLCDRWMDWPLAHLLPAFFDLFWGFYRTPEPLRAEAFVTRAVERCTQTYDALDAALADRPYLAGDRLTMADVPAGASLHRYLALEVDRSDLPNIRRWYERLGDRPAYRENIMQPFDELRARLAF